MAELDNRMLEMTGPLPPSKIFLNKAEVVESLGKHTEITVDFMSTDMKLDLSRMVGQRFTISTQRQNKSWRHFNGIAVDIATLGVRGKYAHYQAKLRSWTYILTLNRECRIYQDKTVIDIIKDVVGRTAFMPEFKDSTTGSFRRRTYCVQYRESDYDFISRLMQEEGIYYTFDHEKTKHTMVLLNSSASHKPIEGKAVVPYYELEENDYRKRQDHIFEWASTESAVPGRVTLQDYNFLTSSTNLKVSKGVMQGQHSHKDQEIYDYQGRYDKTADGNDLALIRLEAEQAALEVKTGTCNLRTMRTGAKFFLEEHPREGEENGEYMVTGARYLLQIDPEEQTNRQTQGVEVADIPGQIEVDEENNDAFRCWFEAIPRTTQFRSRQTTPWPEIAGVLTAVVVGPKGEEIHVDKEGRIRVQFHWDRLGKKDEKSTCWIRHMTPWSGKNWGMIHIPRIGQEVVVQFEDGNPDRPLVMGMLYNDKTMPPYALDANKTESGIVTRSTKSGSASTFHELIFKDEKEKEEIRFQSERDYKQTVKNNAVITVGLEHKDKGDLTQTIHRHKTETLNEGDDTLEVKKGNQNLKIKAGSQFVGIKKDQVEVVEGKSNRQVTGNHVETIKTGNWTTKISAGKGEMTAMQSFEIKVGGSSIKLTPGSIEIKAPMIKIDGSGMTEVKGGGMLKCEGGGMAQFKGGGLAKVEGGGILMLSGPITKIN